MSSPPADDSDDDLPALEPDDETSASHNAVDVFRDIVSLMRGQLAPGPTGGMRLALEIPASTNSIIAADPQTTDFFTLFRHRQAGGAQGLDNEWGAFLTNVLEPRPIRARPSAALGRVLEETLLSSQPVYKGVLSEKGEKLVVERPFDPTKDSELPSCPITQTPFEAGATVAELPCGHIFDPSGVMIWLRKESATCPVCRHKLPSREERVSEDPVSRAVGRRAPAPDASGNSRRRSGAAQMLRNISFLNQPLRAQSLPSWGELRRLLEQQDNAYEEKELQEAILASLRTR